MNKIFILLFYIFLNQYLFAQTSTQSNSCLSDTTKKKYDLDYSEVFKYEYQQALKLFTGNALLFKNACAKFKIDTFLAASIVFPEFIRYSGYKDVLEIFSLEILYVNLGKEYADFSVGIMQMKPSFAEKLENYLKTSIKLSNEYGLQIGYQAVSEKEIRAERLKRLKSAEWQVIYICLFCDIVAERFCKLVFSSNEDKIRFYAAAYNADFLASADKILLQQKKRNFPYGKLTFMPQYAYCEVAVDFYRNHYLKG